MKSSGTLSLELDKLAKLVEESGGSIFITVEDARGGVSLKLPILWESVGSVMTIFMPTQKKATRKAG